jgi:hypothetical protein
MEVLRRPAEGGPSPRPSLVDHLGPDSGLGTSPRPFLDAAFSLGAGDGSVRALPGPRALRVGRPDDIGSASVLVRHCLFRLSAALPPSAGYADSSKTAQVRKIRQERNFQQLTFTLREAICTLQRRQARIPPTDPATVGEKHRRQAPGVSGAWRSSLFDSVQV